jgi:hypothetical protein
MSGDGIKSSDGVRNKQTKQWKPERRGERKSPNKWQSVPKVRQNVRLWLVLLLVLGSLADIPNLILSGFGFEFGLSDPPPILSLSEV